MTEAMKKKIEQGREYRKMLLEVKDTEDTDYTVTGYATTFDEPYTLYDIGDGKVVKEQVSRNAFDGRGNYSMGIKEELSLLVYQMTP